MSAILRSALLGTLTLTSSAAFAGADVTHTDLDDSDCYTSSYGSDVYDICFERTGVAQAVQTPSGNYAVTFNGTYSASYSLNGVEYYSSESSQHQNFLLRAGSSQVFHLESDSEVHYDLNGYCFDSWSDISYQLVNGEFVRYDSEYETTPCE